MTKLHPDQYPSNGQTVMLILPDTAFIKAANISLKQFTKLAPGHISMWLLQVRLPPACACFFPLMSSLLTPQQPLALSKNLLRAVFNPGLVGNAMCHSGQ